VMCVCVMCVCDVCVWCVCVMCVCDVCVWCGVCCVGCCVGVVCGWCVGLVCVGLGLWECGGLWVINKILSYFLFYLFIILGIYLFRWWWWSNLRYHVRGLLCCLIFVFINHMQEQISNIKYPLARRSIIWALQLLLLSFMEGLRLAWSERPIVWCMFFSTHLKACWTTENTT
jgi:phosphate starvation-inducible membrane PsiE